MVLPPDVGVLVHLSRQLDPLLRDRSFSPILIVRTIGKELIVDSFPEHLDALIASNFAIDGNVSKGLRELGLLLLYVALLLGQI